MKRPLKFFTNPHDSIEYIARASLSFAKDNTRKVSFTLRGIDIEVSPSSTVEEIIQEYKDKQDNS